MWAGFPEIVTATTPLYAALRRDPRPSIMRFVVVDHMRRVAFETVLRACAFASLAIFCVMVGMSFSPRICFQSGGFLTTLMTAVLMLKAYGAPTKPYRRTEMWLYLPEEHRPPEAYAQWASGMVMRETYLQFALWTSIIAIVLWVIALVFSLFGK
jgi:hypothetical protein